MSQALSSETYEPSNHWSSGEATRALDLEYKSQLILTAAIASSSKANLDTNGIPQATISKRESTHAGISADKRIKELQAELVRAQQEVKEVKRKAEAAQPDNLLASRASV